MMLAMFGLGACRNLIGIFATAQTERRDIRLPLQFLSLRRANVAHKAHVLEGISC